MSPVDGGTLGTWQVVKPTGTTDTNLCTNPSGETNTTSWSATSGAISRVVGGIFGSYCLRLLASGTNGRIEYSGPQLTVGTLVVASAWVKATSPLVVLRLAYGATVVDQAHPGDGLWHRLSVAGTAQSAVTPIIGIRDGRSSAWANVDADGIQFESGVTAATSFIDGDQDGCIWTGTPHGSTSTRDGRDPRGGTIVSLDSVGLAPKTWNGIGAPVFKTITQGLALGDGELYQSQKAQPRVIQLTALVQGTSLATLHTARAAAFAALNPETRTGRGPIRFRYAGAVTPKTIDAVIESGYGLDQVTAGRAEIVALRMLAPDPIWTGEADEQAALTNGQTLTPVSGLAYKLADGTWSTMAGGITANSSAALYVAIQLLDGRVVVGGTNHLNFGGVAANDNLAVWDGTAWLTLGGTAPNDYITAGALGNDGVLYVAGVFTAIGGVSINRVAQWSPVTNAWTTVGTGGASDAFSSLAIDPATGYLWGAGQLVTTAGGVTINGVGYWTGSAWVAASTGLPAGWAVTTSQALAVGPDGRMYLAIAGATAPGVYVWSGSAWSLYGATTGSALALLSAGGRLYVGGIFTVIGGVVVSNIALTTGAFWSPMAGGTIGGSIRAFATTPDGLIHASGGNWTSIGGVTTLDALASWNGSSWAPFSADPPNTATHANDYYFIYGLRDGSLVIGWFAGSGTFGTTMPTETITNVTNGGSANAYPVIDFLSAGAIVHIANLTTGQRLDFSGCSIATGETARLDFRPGRKTFASQTRTLLAYVLPGSDLATFCLAPGTNRIAVMTSTGTVTIRWRPKHWAAD